MKYLLIPRRVSLLIYNDADSINYTASCQININGTFGTIDTLNGRDFYKFLAASGFTPFTSLGLTSVSAAVSPAHLRLLTRVLGNKVIVKEQGTAKVGDAELIWVTITENLLG